MTLWPARRVLAQQGLQRLGEVAGAHSYEAKHGINSSILLVFRWYAFRIFQPDCLVSCPCASTGLLWLFLGSDLPFMHACRVERNPVGRLASACVTSRMPLPARDLRFEDGVVPSTSCTKGACGNASPFFHGLKPGRNTLFCTPSEASQATRRAHRGRPRGPMTWRATRNAEARTGSSTTLAASSGG